MSLTRSRWRASSAAKTSRPARVSTIGRRRLSAASRLPRNEAVRLEAAQDATDVAGVEPECRLEVGRDRAIRLGDLEQEARLGEREGAVEKARVERADEPGVEAIEAAHGGDGGIHVGDNAPIVVIVKYLERRRPVDGLKASRVWRCHGATCTTATRRRRSGIAVVDLAERRRPVAELKRSCWPNSLVSLRGTMIDPAEPSRNEHRGWHTPRKLPHFDSAETSQAITFRLADALPRSVVAAKLGEGTAAHRRRIEAALDRGAGACWLRRPEVARIVEAVLMKDAGAAYDLHAFVVMPNHVHALITQSDGHRLAGVVQAWKGISAKAINKVLGRTGQVLAARLPRSFHARRRRISSARGPTSRAIPSPRVSAAAPADWPCSSASR